MTFYHIRIFLFDFKLAMVISDAVRYNVESPVSIIVTKISACPVHFKHVDFLLFGHTFLTQNNCPITM